MLVVGLDLSERTGVLNVKKGGSPLIALGQVNERCAPVCLHMWCFWWLKACIEK